MQLGNLQPASGSGNTPGYQAVRIDHQTGLFNIPGVSVKPRSLDIVGLGLIRSRTYWQRTKVAANHQTSKVICKSHDAVVGHPSQNDFPWSESEFARVDSNATLPCEQCSFKSWNGGEQPRCKQTWTIPCLVPMTSNPLQVFTINFTASSIPALTEYLTPFRDNGVPMYTRFTSVSLKRVSKGDSVFTKAEFEKGSETSVRLHHQYSRLLREVREFMQPKDEGVPFVPLPLQQQQ